MCRSGRAASISWPASETLAELRYRGPFLIEMWTEKAAEPVVEIAQARRWLLEQMRLGGLLPDEGEW